MPFLTIIWGWIAKAAWPVIWHALQRFWSVLIVGLIVLSCWLWWRGYIAKIRNESCKVCISEYTQSHPTMGAGSTTIINTNVVKTAGPEIDGWGFGFWHRR